MRELGVSTAKRRALEQESSSSRNATKPAESGASNDAVSGFNLPRSNIVYFRRRLSSQKPTDRHRLNHFGEIIR